MILASRLFAVFARHAAPAAFLFFCGGGSLPARLPRAPLAIQAPSAVEQGIGDVEDAAPAAVLQTVPRRLSDAPRGLPA